MLNNNDTALDRLRVGETGRITDMHCGRRLCDLGFTEGTEIECVLESPSGSMRAYLVRGAVIALRLDDVRKVRVERKI